jgi:predicted amidohydrolase
MRGILDRAAGLSRGLIFNAVLVAAGLAGLIVSQAACSPAQSASGKTVFQADAFPVVQDLKQVQGWETWSQRAETSPVFFTAELPSLGGAGSLGITGASNSSAHGCWRKTVTGIAPGRYYRFEASYQTENVAFPRQQVLARLDWRDASGARVGQPEYVPELPAAGKWMKAGGAFKAPEKAAAVYIELYLSFCPQGRVWWDGISLNQIPDPPKRMVRVATVSCYPRETENSTASVEEFCKLVEEAGRQKCDIVCLGEAINMVGIKSGPPYSEIAEPIPGPTTNRLGELARKYNMYIVAALGERENQAIYNAGVLIDRQGRVAGKYHKVFLPREEIEAGVTPGAGYPVFDTDFGRIGMMICWDVQYVDPARALAVQGAEIVFMPIWDGFEVLAQARAIENQVYLVSCSYGETPFCAVYDPWGKVLAAAKKRPGIAYADIDLNETHPDPWLGDMKLRLARERRSDIRVPELEQ